ncbi:MAG: hypothetical protein IE916_09705 [Epsilonproteobacteria bacterium]|nr:hypothetical protein [Campylobacterota bacterium]
MKFSYIRPRRKSPFTQEFQLLFSFFGIAFFMLLSTYAFLLFKEYRFEAEQSRIESEIVELNTSINQMYDEIGFVRQEIALSEKIFTQNSVLKESITNLFDLIPERIVLSEANLMKNGLILYGITPNQDIYNFMLQAPLRSIFHKSYSSFYPMQNGWLRFVSTNYLESAQEDE